MLTTALEIESIEQFRENVSKLSETQYMKLLSIVIFDRYNIEKVHKVYELLGLDKRGGK